MQSKLANEILSVFQNLKSALIRKEKKNTYAAVNAKRKTKKIWALFYNRLLDQVL